MISKNQQKYIRSLETKKGRAKEGAFVAEGPKVVADLMTSFEPLMTVATAGWYVQSGRLPQGRDAVVNDDELRHLSFLQHPQQVMAVFPIISGDIVAPLEPGELCLALDGVQDPGNLGTIIRIADWFGIRRIVCSEDTADWYNPKVVQATMGSMARVSCCYTNLHAFLASLPESTPLFGTFLDGRPITSNPLPASGVIVMGNEGKGISEQIAGLITHRLLIPNYPVGSPTADSLNVAIATAITCYEFRRGR